MNSLPSSRRIVAILIFMGVVTLLGFVFFTDSIRYDLLPRIDAKVKAKLCPLWTGTCGSSQDTYKFRGHETVLDESFIERSQNNNNNVVRKSKILSVKTGTKNTGRKGNKLDELKNKKIQFLQEKINIKKVKDRNMTGYDSTAYEYFSKKESQHPEVIEKKILGKVRNKGKFRSKLIGGRGISNKFIESSLGQKGNFSKVKLGKIGKTKPAYHKKQKYDDSDNEYPTTEVNTGESTTHLNIGKSRKFDQNDEKHGFQSPVQKVANAPAGKVPDGKNSNSFKADSGNLNVSISSEQDKTSVRGKSLTDDNGPPHRLAEDKLPKSPNASSINKDIQRVSNGYNAQVNEENPPATEDVMTRKRFPSLNLKNVKLNDDETDESTSDVVEPGSGSQRKGHVMPSLFLGEPWTGRSLEPLMKDMRLDTYQNDYDFLQRHIDNGGVNVSFLSRLPWPDTDILPFEEKLLSDPRLDNENLAASYAHSKVTLLHPKTSYNVGDVLRVRVDVFDSRGMALTRGGDEVRVWLVERSKAAAIAGVVADMRNGSYLALVKVRWTGLQQIHAELTYSRETLRLYQYIRYINKCIRFVAAGFLKGPLSEATLCSYFPQVPGYENVCNFTDPIYGTSWFCGKPRKLGLSCMDWTMFRDMEFLKPFPLSSAEQIISSRLRAPPPIRLIPKNIVVHVASGKPTAPKKSCGMNHLKDTWQISRPRGFFLHGHWVRTDCRPKTMTLPKLRSCLRNTTLVFTGDSNLLMMFEDLSVRMSCSLMETPGTTWHRPRMCVTPKLNFEMSWHLHGFPVHPNSDHWISNDELRSVTQQLDTVPDKGRHVIIIHLFIHFSVHHYSLFRNHVSAVQKAAVKLLQRNPEAIIVVRGPHTAYTGWPPILGGDMPGPLMREVWVHEFGSHPLIKDRAVYVDFWDMTIATENPEFHPNRMVNAAMVNVILQHICDR